MGGSDRTAAMDFFNNSDEGKMARNLGLSVEDLQEVFDQFDTDGSGGIDSKEFGTLLASLDIVWDDAKIETTVKGIDADENGLIDFMEHIPSAEDIEGHVEPEEEGPPWMMTLAEQYARKMQGDESAEVDEALIASLLQEFCEIVAVGKAALPLVK